MDGILIIDKPAGRTSFEVVREARRAARARKAGHAGTLDPLATGVLVVCLGEGTKLASFLVEGEKEYLVRVALGAATDTDDREGRITETAPVPPLDRARLERAIGSFVGDVTQVPPAFSALKVGGEALHRKARRGEPVTPRPRRVEIGDIRLVDVGPDWIDLDVRCGKGTYVRALARDLGLALGTRAHVAELRRIASSGFVVEEAHALEAIRGAAARGDLASLVVPPAQALRGLPHVTAGDDDASRLRKGQAIAHRGGERFEKGLVKVVDATGRLVAVARAAGDRLRPVRVFHAEGHYPPAR